MNLFVNYMDDYLTLVALPDSEEFRSIESAGMFLVN